MSQDIELIEFIQASEVLGQGTSHVRVLTVIKNAVTRRGKEDNTLLFIDFAGVNTLDKAGFSFIIELSIVNFMGHCLVFRGSEELASQVRERAKVTLLPILVWVSDGSPQLISPDTRLNEIRNVEDTWKHLVLWEGWQTARQIAQALETSIYKVVAYLKVLYNQHLIFKDFDSSPRRYRGVGIAADLP